MTTRLIQPAIRRIRPEDAEAWREVRLRALQDAPEAFGSTYVETLARPSEHWTERAANSAAGSENTMFLADDGDRLVGLAGGYRESTETEVRELIGMWVEPEARGSRLAERLVNQVVDWAALAGAGRIELWVTETNARARHFYERQGFVATGDRQPHPSNPALAEIKMSRSLEDHIAIRRIRSYETEAWRATRLAALKDAPTAFGPTFEETLARPVTHWSDRIQDAASGDQLAVFAAVRGRNWVGLAGAGSSWAAPNDPEGTVHLGSVWIAPDARGHGLLPRLLDAAYDWAAGTGAERMVLDVTETNERAIAIYERYGYRLTGISQPLRPGSNLRELRMSMDIAAARGGELMPSPLVFFQLTASDPAATYAFLDALFGWEPADPDERGTISIRAGGPGDFDVTGVLMPQRPGQQQATLFFRVEDLPATVARAEELGGRIVMSIRRSTPTGPHLAIVSTPDGELNVGIVQA